MSELAQWEDRFAPEHSACASPDCPVPERAIWPGDTVLADGTGRQVHEDCEVPGE
jgi:hypothetical protein